MKSLLTLLATASVFVFDAAPTLSQTPEAIKDPTEAAFRDTFKELVETNTSHSVGSCTLAAERMAARLKAAGYADADIHLYAPPEAPKDGLVVAVLHGKDPKAKGVLLLAHLDVVEAKREDWTRDPFTLIEEDGFFYARGVIDDKAHAAIFTDLMVRFKQEGYRPRVNIKLALTCGEETEGVFNGARWLSENHKDWIDAGVALNEGAGGSKDAKGQYQLFTVVGAEKVYQDFSLIATDPGGHSSQPTPTNPIYRMARGLERLETYRFPINLSDTTRTFFTRAAPLQTPEMGKAMLDIVANPGDAAADSILSRDKQFNATLRTTCTPTMVEGGHAFNALPQSVKVNVNCRILPGEPIETIRTAIVAAVADPTIDVDYNGEKSIATPTPPLSKDFLKAVDYAASKVYPNVPVMPALSTGASDSIYTNAVGIPTYGVLGIFREHEGNGAHGLNERVGVKALMDGRRFHYELVKTLTK